MLFNKETYRHIQSVTEKDVTIVAVSKLQSVEAIRDAYDFGIRDFGENYVQEMVDKAAKLPEDIRWHFIGHLQSNKIKYIAPFVHLIQGVDSLKLLKALDKEAGKTNRKLCCLLQVHIAKEETKYGFNESDLEEVNYAMYPNLSLQGMMGMSTFTDDVAQLEAEFGALQKLYNHYKTKFPEFRYLSMGMSGDYGIAVKNGSNMVRIGSALFGARAKC